MKVSVAMATYNGARYIGGQLASIAAQSRPPDELVVSDDCSTDRTAELVEEFAVKVPFRVTLHRNPERLGFDRNFENALAHCTGDLILIADQDDEWYPDKIETLTSALHDGSYLAIVHDQHVVDQNGQRYGLTYWQGLQRIGYSRSDLISGNLMGIRRPLLRCLRPFPSELHYDAWIALFTEVLGVRLLIDSVLQAYRRHETNATQSNADLRRPSRLRTFVRRGMRNPRVGWQQQIRHLRLVKDRIEEHREHLLSLVEVTRIERARTVAERRIALLKRRLDLISKPRWKRGPAVVAAWRQGFYAQFSGGRSAITDLIRR